MQGNFALNADIVFMKEKIILSCTIILALLTCGCAKKNAHYYAKKQGLDFGFAVTSGDLIQHPNVDIVAENATMIVSENNMKCGNLRPNRRFWNWSDVDNLMEFAQKNDITVKFHTLFWHQQNPPFISNLTTGEEALVAMDEHIQTVMERYRGKVKVYDVVNEMFNEDGTMRETIWYNLIGPEYIEHALRKARECDPNAKLYLNEYNNENLGYAKSEALYNLVKDYKKRGVPIDGIGMQLHLDGTQPLNEDAIRENIRRYAELGIEISFSEIDVRIPSSDPKSHEKAQGDIYCALLKMALDEPNVKSYIMWGYSDNGSWIPGTFPTFGYALPFDYNRNPKPVYAAMVEMLKTYKRR